jgi:hypothetical protein
LPNRGDIAIVFTDENSERWSEEWVIESRGNVSEVVTASNAIGNEAADRFKAFEITNFNLADLVVKTGEEIPDRTADFGFDSRGISNERGIERM